MFDPADNPYMPRSQQNVRLALGPTDLDFLHPFPAFPPAAHAPVMLAVGPMAYEGEMAAGPDDIDDNSDLLDPIEDHEFPLYFQQIGTPPRLFHSHGSYVLPVDSDETKVCYKPVRAQTRFPYLHSNMRSRWPEARSSTYPAPYGHRKQL